MKTQAGDRLTERQQEILDYFQAQVLANHRPPTVREIGEAFGITSTNGVQVHLHALVKKGALVAIPQGTGRSRYALPTVTCPHCGKEIGKSPSASSASRRFKHA